MGIKDLLRFMKPYVEPIHIKKYAGKRVGIDAYSWLHKGAYSCSMELCLDMDGDKKFQYLNYCMHRINLLRHHNISPVVVFDGGSIPCKAQTEQDRNSKRKANRELAMQKFKEGNVNAAAEIFQRAVSITPSMAHQLIQILRSENIEFVVAPYEADAQLAYLSSLGPEEGGIAAVISEDSDLLAYGCSAVVFKMDRYGNGEEIMMDKVFNSVGHVPSFRHFDNELFTGMCVLAGCDFLPSVPGIGIAKSHAYVSKYRNLDRVLSILKYEKGNQVPENYLKSFKEAVAVFQHALIYDADSKMLKHLKPLPETLIQSLDEELNFLGPKISSLVASEIAEGLLDPCTRKAYVDIPSRKNHLKRTSVDQHSNRLTGQEANNVTKTPGQLSRQETTNVSTEASCFTVISSQKTGIKRITVMEQKPALVKRKSGNTDEWGCSTETLKLERLMSPMTSEVLSEEKVITSRNPSMVPNNNPFKIRKFEASEAQSTDSITRQQSITEQHSVVTEVDDLEILSVTSNSQQIVKVETQTDCVTEHSVVTEVEDLEILCITPDSQKSMDSKPVKKTAEKKRVKNQRKLKSTTEKKNTILNFFPRS